jgi:hypothetical protein
MVLINLSPADIHGIGLTIAGFDVNCQLRTFQLFNLFVSRGTQNKPSFVPQLPQFTLLAIVLLQYIQPFKQDNLV